MMTPELEPNERRYFDCGQLDVIIEDPSDMVRFISESRLDTVLVKERFDPSELALVTNSLLSVQYNAEKGDHRIDGRIAFAADSAVTSDDMLFNLGMSLIELHGHSASEIRSHGFGTEKATLLFHSGNEPTGIVIVPSNVTTDNEDGEPISLVLMHSVFDATQPKSVQRLCEIMQLWGQLHDVIGHEYRGLHGAYSQEAKRIIIPRLHASHDDALATFQILSEYEHERGNEAWMPAVDFKNLDVADVASKLGGFNETELRSALAALATRQVWRPEIKAGMVIGNAELVKAVQTLRAESEL